MAFDEEEQQYKIYDKKCIFDDGEKFPPPYLFNEGNRGELLELSFEANFSKEAKTAILLASEPKTREAAIEYMEIDGYNQHSVWTELMNLPALLPQPLQTHLSSQQEPPHVISMHWQYY